jgi:Fe-S-cluster containining protein
MIGLVAVAVAIALLILAWMGAAMFFDVALGSGARVVTTRETEARKWTPPYVSGDELSGWARSTASGAVEDVVGRVPASEAPGEIMHRLNGGAAQAMLPGLHPGSAKREVACPQAGQGVIGVTAPEAMQIAAYLRRQFSRSELKSVRDESERTARHLAESRSRSVADAPCALQGDDCVCMAYPERPVSCRPLHATILADELNLPLTPAGPGSAEAAAHMDVIGRAISDGLAQGLESAGLDAKLYELHAALVMAIDHPDAAERWASGESLFESGGVAQVERAAGPQLLR